MFKLGWFTLFFICLLQTSAAPTKVGNGNDGKDLVHFKKIDSGKLVQTKAKAVAYLKSLRIHTVKGLGRLINEVQHSPTYLAKENLSPKILAELGAFTNDTQGLIYARTFPHSLAPTRFFPAALGLSEKQLITLHIHEGLHRALPKNLRQNEAVVSEVSSAITSEQTSIDLIDQTMAKYIQPASPESSHSKLASTPSSKLVQELKPEPHSRILSDSRFGFSMRNYRSHKNESTSFFSPQIKTMYRLNSELYPFGDQDSSLGFGINLSFLKNDRGTSPGPMELSIRKLVWTYKKFDVGLYAQVGLHMLSDEELQQSLLGRDIYRVGMDLTKQSRFFYIKNSLEYTFRSKAEQTIGLVDYTYEFGDIYSVEIEFGGHVGGFKVGGFGEVLLSKNFTASGGALGTLETGRNRIMAAGPKISYQNKHLGAELKGRWLLDSTQNTDLDFLGDLMGQGVGQGHIELGLIFFM